MPGLHGLAGSVVQVPIPFEVVPNNAYDSTQITLLKNGEIILLDN
jgi:hypothetical protein